MCIGSTVAVARHALLELFLDGGGPDDVQAVLHGVGRSLELLVAIGDCGGGGCVEGCEFVCLGVGEDAQQRSCC